MTTAAERGRDDRWEAGTVTAEFAIVLPAAVVALLLVLTVLAVGVTRLECTDAARAATRAAALGESRETITRIGRQAAPDAAVSIAGDGAWTSVTLTCPVDLALFAGPWRVTSTFATPVEPAGAGRP